VSLRDLVEGVVKTRREQAAAKSLALEFQSDGDPLMAVCDPARIEQVVRSLLSNSIKCTDHGGVAVRVSRDGEHARLVFTDTGAGITPELLETMFQPSDTPPAASPSRSTRGLGIGLSLARELVSAHEGRIQAESEGAERGATFTVWLRLAEPLKAAAPAAPVAEEDNPLRGLRVVLVDDSVDLLTSFGALITLEGAQVDSFASAEAALKRLLEADADLLISDLGMPDMDGYELIKEVRKHPRLASLPAIALTGYGRTRDPGHAVRSGFNAHTTKPATVEELKNIVALLKSL
jgi:two-component system CheB/CheR fusion protein